MTKNILTMILASLISISVVSLAGCETMKGMGRDTEKAGDEIEDTAEDWD